MVLKSPIHSNLFLFCFVFVVPKEDTGLARRPIDVGIREWGPEKLSGLELGDLVQTVSLINHLTSASPLMASVPLFL